MPAAARLPARLLALVIVAALAAACSQAGHGGPAASSPASAAPSAAAASSSPAPRASAGIRGVPGIVAVTTAGALVALKPGTGTVARTLVSSGVVGDEISVDSTGMVYFAARHDCADEIESVPDTGGTPVVITTGSLPALSPDGSKVAFTSQPISASGCGTGGSDPTSRYQLVVRTLATGDQARYPMLPAAKDTGLPAPISHLSWSPDGQDLAVSISSVQDNEGWNLALLNTATARYYLTGSGVSFVPVTGHPAAKDSYLREGVYLPDGDLFVSRACCAGFPVRNTSRLMWEVTTAGTLVHQVAIGYPRLDHTSLDASADGTWLLYLAGHDLYVSRGGATPGELTTGLVAAAWR